MDTYSEIRENEIREKNPDLFPQIETEICDVCQSRSEDFRLAPDKGGYCCLDCFNNGTAEDYYIENGATKEQMILWLDNLKIK